MDKDCQSLNASVHTKLYEVAIDATNALIICAIDGYMSVNNMREGRGGMCGGNKGSGTGGTDGGMQSWGKRRSETNRR